MACHVSMTRVAILFFLMNTFDDKTPSRYYFSADNRVKRIDNILKCHLNLVGIDNFLIINNHLKNILDLVGLSDLLSPLLQSGGTF